MSRTCSFISSCFSYLSLRLQLIPLDDRAKNSPWKLAWVLAACFAFNSDPSTMLYIFNLGLETLRFRKSLYDCCFDSSLKLENMSSVSLCSFRTIQKGN